jgi:hypothetical protein
MDNRGQKGCWMKSLFLAVLFLFFAFPVLAQNILDPEILRLSNDAMRQINRSILSERPSVPALENFDETVISQNAFGIPLIQYETTLKSGSSFAFALTIAPMNEDAPFSRKRGVFVYPFPILGVKFVGFQMGSVLNFNVENLARQYGHPLWLRQQESLPFELTLSATNNVVRVGEDIEFTVSLKNRTGKMMLVKNLSAQTLFFLYNNRPWGISEIKKMDYQTIKNVRLGPWETVKKKFRGQGFRTPQDVVIYGSYIMTFKDVKPEAILNIKVLE